METATTTKVWHRNGDLSSDHAEKNDRASGVVDDNRHQFVEWNDSLGHYINNTLSSNLTDYMHINSTDDNINSFFFYEKEQFTVLWILFLSIVLGNTGVLVALFFSKSRKSRMNFFIMQLAIADLLVGLISVLTDIVWRMSVSWKAGNTACKFIRFLQAMVTYSSTFVLVALSIDRYDAITNPMNFSGSWRRARLLVVCAWSLSALFSSPLIFLFEERVIQDKLQCWIDFSAQWQWQVYMTLVATTVFLIPAVIITGCYTVIVYTIWSKSKTLSPIKRAECTKNGEVEPDIRRSSSRGIIPRAKIKTVKMTFVIVIVFILCWSPYIVFDLLQVYDQIPKTQTNIAVATFIQSLAPLNSAANPIIYCLFSTHTCRTLRKLPPLSWIPCCWRGGVDSSSFTETLTSSNRQASSSLLRNNTTQIRPILRSTIVNNNNNNNNTEDSLL